MSTSKYPKLSLVTVCLNSRKTIEKTFQSVLTQDYDNIEYIVIDGNSTDGTQAIIEQYRIGIDHYISEADSGLYEAMNKGIRLATGDIIAFLNADDVFESEKSVRQLLQPFQDKHIDCVFSDLVYVNADNKIVRYWQSSPYVKGAFGWGWSPAHPTFYARKELYDKFGSFNCGLSFGNDVELMMRFLEKNEVVSLYIPKVMVRMLIGGISNRSVKTIWIQNTSTIRLAKNYGVPCHPIMYLVRKFTSRILQLVMRPKWGQ
jgi:glycosyltransferase involved in cell wall biosynthesis